MRRLTDRSAPGRAVIAVAAIYVLCLQALLAGLQPVAPLADPAGVICAEHGTAGDPSGDSSLPCRQHACCLPKTAVHALISPAPFSVVPLALPTPRAVRLAWQPADSLAPRAPPDIARNPRGPPTA